MTAQDIYRRAVEARKAKAGVRVKVRMPESLWRDATACAEAIGWTSEEWVCGVVRQHLAGKFAGVDIARETLLGTRDGSVCVWVRVPEGFDHRGDGLRTSVACAVAAYIPKMARYECAMVEGRDYVVADGEDW